jgi:hypothetical protein
MGDDCYETPPSPFPQAFNDWLQMNNFELDNQLNDRRGMDNKDGQEERVTDTWFLAIN